MATPSPQLKAITQSEPSPLDLGAVQLVDVVACVVAELDAGGQRVQMVLERTPTVCADSAKLAEVTSSLLQDALRSCSSSRPIKVEVAGRCLGADHEAESCQASVAVAVQDRGTPRVGPATASLADANAIIKMHRGRLWSAEHRGEGRTSGFCLTSERAA